MAFNSKAGYTIDQGKLLDSINSVELTEGQQEAIGGLIEWYDTWRDHGEAGILNGNPGTGKSFTLVQYILNLVNYRISQRQIRTNADFKVILCAPTNQAKENVRNFSQENNLWKYCSVMVTTVHALAGMRMDGLDDEGFSLDLWDHQGDKFKADLVICDEYSMVDEYLYQQLQPVLDKCPVLFVGDINQLEPVPHAKYKRTVKPGQSVVNNENPNFQFLLSETVRFTGSILGYTYQILSTYGKSTIKAPSLPTDDLLTMDDQIRVMDRDEFIAEEMKKWTSDERFWTELNYCKVLNFTNKGVTHWNKHLRADRYGDQACKINESEQLIVKEPVYGMVDDQIKRLFYTNQKFIPEAIEEITLIPEIEESLGRLTFQKVYAMNTYGRMTEFLIPTRETMEVLSPYFMNRFNELKILSSKAKEDENKKANNRLQWNEWQRSLNLYGLAYKKNPEDRKPIKRQVIPYYSSTIHSMQGTTLDHVIVDWSDVMTARSPSDKKRLAYVAMSRAKESVTILV